MFPEIPESEGYSEFERAEVKEELRLEYWESRSEGEAMGLVRKGSMVSPAFLP